jgi:hypothetical protein
VKSSGLRDANAGDQRRDDDADQRPGDQRTAGILLASLASRPVTDEQRPQDPLQPTVPA